jgi:hypothetical protein
MDNKEPTKEPMEKFDPVKDNPCWECPHRQPSKYDSVNICLLDENEKCVKDE